MPAINANAVEPIKRYHAQIERYLAFTFGVAFICTMLSVSIYIPEPSSFQHYVFRVVVSLAAAGFSTTVPGFISVEVNKYIKAGGAICIFLICYWSSPAYLNAVSGEATWQEQNTSFSAGANNQFRMAVSGDGTVNVLKDSMRVFVKDFTISYPKAFNGAAKDYIDKLSILLACREDTAQGVKLKAAGQSDFYKVDRWIDAGQSISIPNLDFTIQKSKYPLSECNIQLTAFIGTKETGSGTVIGAAAPNIFK